MNAKRRFLLSKTSAASGSALFFSRLSSVTRKDDSVPAFLKDLCLPSRRVSGCVFGLCDQTGLRPIWSIVLLRHHPFPPPKVSPALQFLLERKHQSVACNLFRFRERTETPPRRSSFSGGRLFPSLRAFSEGRWRITFSVEPQRRVELQFTYYQ